MLNTDSFWLKEQYVSLRSRHSTYLTGLEIRILEPGAIPLKIVRKLLLVYFFVHKFIWEPGAFYYPASANLLFCSCYFKACYLIGLPIFVFYVQLWFCFWSFYFSNTISELATWYPSYFAPVMSSFVSNGHLQCLLVKQSVVTITQREHTLHILCDCQNVGRCYSVKQW